MYASAGFFLGKIITLGGDVNEFAGGRGDTQFLSHSFLASSVTALMNPYSAPGAGIFWMPNEEVTVTSSIYTSNDASTSNGFDELDEGRSIFNARLKHEPFLQSGFLAGFPAVGIRSDVAR